MSSVNPTSPLAMASDRYLKQLYTQSLNKPLDLDHVTITVLPAQSKIRVGALAYTEHGEVGKYKGFFEVEYVKADLNKILPHPVLYTGNYPVQYGELCESLLNTYGMVLEENEFTLDGTTPLTNSSLLDIRPAVNSDIVKLTALPESGRWKSGSYLSLRIAVSNHAQSLASIIAQGQPGSISKLFDTFP